MPPWRRILFLHWSQRPVTQNSPTPDFLRATAACLTFCVLRYLPDVPGALSCGWETVLQNKQELWSEKLDLASVLMFVKHFATVSAALKGSDGQFSHQASEYWDLTRAQGSLKKTKILKNLVVLWKPSTREFPKAQEVKAKAGGAKAQQL